MCIRDRLYINTSTELWDPYAAGPNQHPTEKTLYWRHMNLRRMLATWKAKGPTAVIEHGANPGLISHFVKQGLIDIGHSLIADKKLKGKAAETVAELIALQQFNHLARAIGVKVIHCSERDTQITDQQMCIRDRLCVEVSVLIRGSGLLLSVASVSSCKSSDPHPYPC